MEPVTPELALVDPDLAARARQSSTTHAPTEAVVASEGRDASRSRSSELADDVDWTASSFRIAVVVLMVASAFLGPAVSDLMTRRSDAGASVPSAQIGSRRAPDLRVSPIRVLRWQGVAGATLYDLVLWRDGVRMLDIWPHVPRANVPTASLEPGTYRWVVYWTKSRGARGGAIGRGAFTIRAPVAP